MKDEEIIKNIRSRRHDAPIRFLYRELPKVSALILASGGSKADARETFHDALILLIEKVEDPTFILSSKLTTYLYGITRLLWKNKLRKRQKNRELEWADTLILNNEDLGFEEDRETRIRVLENVLTRISKRCQELFSRFYFNRESMAEIADAMGFSSINSAKTQKYKCMEQAIRIGSEINPQNSRS